MKKRFNTTGPCINKKHYMVDISYKILEVENLIDNGDYFVINRPRQYGKTTLLSQITKKLNDKYLIIRTSFEGIGDSIFKSEEEFSIGFLKLISQALYFTDEEKSKELELLSNDVTNLYMVSNVITKFVKSSNKAVILLIDEVDKASNNQLFLSFLGMLRNKYILASDEIDYTFHSVILAGVHDIKNLKLKLRADEEKKYNSPWNIAVNFNVDMSFNEREIGTMLNEYAIDNNINLDIELLSKEIYKFTSGYPYLVSRICQIIDIDLLKNRDELWSKFHIQKAIKILLEESNTLFDDLIKNMENNPELYEYMYKLLILNIPSVFNIDNPSINLGVMFGYLDKDNNNNTIVSNKVIRERIYNYLVSKTDSKTMTSYNFKDNFICEYNGLNMEKILLKFQQFMKENYSTRDVEFLERQGVLLFLSFIKPIINGVGFDYKEVQISQERRLDIVIQYNQNKYVIETKIWHGDVANKNGLKQLKNYLDIQSLDRGYLLIFNFNKNKVYSNIKHNIEGKEIFEVTV